MVSFAAGIVGRGGTANTLAISRFIVKPVNYGRRKERGGE